jgi:DNA polymerase III epsilon subunit-like protein
VTYHVMLDLETLATDSNAQIVSIGAVKFDSRGLGSEFYSTIILEGNSPFSVNPQTVGWWFKQSQEARDALFTPEPKRIQDVLRDFQLWFKEAGDSGKEVWGNGVNFDNTILRNAFEKCHIKCPWHFRDDRCYRTVVALNKHKGIQYKRVGTHHNALDDAKTQAMYLIKLGVL